jgi:hypothetical protein
MFSLRTKRRKGGTPHPPPKFAVFHKKFAENSTLKVRPIQSPTKYVGEKLTSGCRTIHRELHWRADINLAERILISRTEADCDGFHL